MIVSTDNLMPLLIHTHTLYIEHFIFYASFLVFLLSVHPMPQSCHSFKSSGLLEVLEPKKNKSN